MPTRFAKLFRSRSGARPPEAPAHKFRPGLETLEDRCLMATRVWDGGAVSNNWTSANNWVGNVAPVAGDDLVFSAGASDKTADNNFAAGTFFNSITLGGGYTLRGARVSLGAGGIIDNSGTSNIIKFDIELGSLTSSFTLRPFQVGAGSTLFIDGEISSTSGTFGGQGVSKTGTGNLSFRANNSYSGETIVNAGILFVEKDGSLGSTLNQTIVRAGATLLFNDTALGALKVDEDIDAEGGSTLRALNDVELGGTINLLGFATIRQESSQLISGLTLGNRIVGPGGLSIASGSRVIYDAFSDNQGSLNVSGTLIITDGARLPLDVAMNIFTLGTVKLEDDGLLSSTPVSFNGGAELDLNGHDSTVPDLFMNGGRIQGGGQLTVEGQFRATSTSTVNFARISGADILLLDPDRTVLVTDGPAFNDLLVENGAFLGGFVKEGDGVMLLTQNLSAVENFVVNAGLLRLHANFGSTTVTVNDGGELAGDGSVGNLIVNAGGRVRPGPLSSTGVLRVTNDLTLNPGAILEVTMNGPVAGTGHDQLDVERNVVVDGAILEATVGTGAATGNQFRFINNGGTDAVLGRFAVPAGGLIVSSPSGRRLQLNHAGGALGNDVVATLVNTPPMAPGLALNATEIDRWQTVTASGVLVDPDGRQSLRLIVDWGDGSRREVFRPGLDNFTLRHRYRRAGEFTANFRWIDQTGQGNSREFTITVNDAPLPNPFGRSRQALTDSVFAQGLRR